MRRNLELLLYIIELMGSFGFGGFARWLFVSFWFHFRSKLWSSWKKVAEWPEENSDDNPHRIVIARSSDAPWMCKNITTLIYPEFSSLMPHRFFFFDSLSLAGAHVPHHFGSSLRISVNGGTTWMARWGPSRPSRRLMPDSLPRELRSMITPQEWQKRNEYEMPRSRMCHSSGDYILTIWQIRHQTASELNLLRFCIIFSGKMVGLVYLSTKGK